MPSHIPSHASYPVANPHSINPDQVLDASVEKRSHVLMFHVFHSDSLIVDTSANLKALLGKEISIMIQEIADHGSIIVSP